MLRIGIDDTTHEHTHTHKHTLTLTYTSQSGTSHNLHVNFLVLGVLSIL